MHFSVLPFAISCANRRAEDMSKKKQSDELLSWPTDLLRIIGPEEAEQVSSVSWDTIRRNYPSKIVQISQRRVGIRLGDALMLASKTKSKSAA
jgi:hypothetical protein